MKRKLVFLAIVVTLLISVTALAACTTSMEDYYADLQKQAEEVNADLKAVFTETAKYDYTTSFDITHYYYNGATRGDENTPGWKDGDDGYTWMYEDAYLEIVKKGDVITTTATIYLPVKEDDYDNSDIPPVAYASAKGSVNGGGELSVEWVKFGAADGEGAEASLDELKETVGDYDMRALLTLWYDMIAAYSDISDSYADITAAPSGFKIYQDIAQVAYRYVYDLDGNKYDSWHDPEGDKLTSLPEGSTLMSVGYNTDIAYNWNVISALRHERISVTSNTKDRMKSLEFFVEDIMVYYDEISVMNDDLTLYADVCGNTDFVAKIEITED